MLFRQDYSLNKKLPNEVKNFKEEIINEILVISNRKPDIERILKTLVWVTVEDTKLIETEKGISNEGQKLTGYKLIVKIKLKEQITYVAKNCKQLIHIVNYETIKNIVVILSEKIADTYTYELARKEQLIVVPYVECVESRMLGNRYIHQCVMLIVDVRKI